MNEQSVIETVRRRGADAPLRVGLIGLGTWGMTRARAMVEADHLELVAVCSRNEAHVRTSASGLGCAWYTDYLELLSRTDINVVAIYTPTGSHEQIAATAMQAGKHVVVTKPPATTLAGAKRMVATAGLADVLLAVEYTYRYRAGSIEAKRAVSSGAVGRILHADYSMTCYRPQEYYDAGDFRGTWKRDGGGAVMMQGIHAIDQMLWIQGMPTEVRAVTATLDHDIETEDVGFALFTYDDGTVASFSASTVARLSREPIGGYGPTTLRCSIFGSSGNVVIEQGVVQQLVSDPEWSPTRSTVEPASDLFDDLRNTFCPPRRQDDVTSLVLGGESIDALAVVEAIYESARTGRATAIDRSGP